MAIFLFFVGLCLNGYAQIKRVPLERYAPQSEKTKTSSRAKKQSLTVPLPFFDDFSSTETLNPSNPEAGFPKQDLWEKSFEVWINEGIGIDPPSINVATLDGLDSAGAPYSNQPTENGFRDVLMTNQIDLAAVPEAERSSVYLSFYYQWQGNGEPPDEKDYFRVEFLDKDSVWVPALTISPKLSFTRESFYDTIVQVNGSQYFHEKFRFRFRNYGRLSGPFDTWNLDYIYLNKNRNQNDLTFLDRAIASQLSPIFGNYRSVPIKHFRNARLYTVPQVDIQNLRGGPAGAPTDYNMMQGFYNYVDGALTLVTKPFGPIASKYPDNNLQPGERFRSTLRTDKDPIDFNDPAFNFDSYFLPDADSIDLKVKIDIFEPDNGVFSSNDTISSTYHLNNFYAYDDGTAEYAAVLSQTDDQIAIGFDILGSDPQELVGFDVYVPSYGVSGFTPIDFFIMDALNGEPNDKITTVTHIIRTTRRDGFQAVRFDPIIVTDEFFIGWRGSSNAQLKVGLDYSNNTVNRIYEDLYGVTEDGKIKWFPAEGLTEGSIMIRPNFGDKGIFTGVTPENTKVTFYPNPSNGQFFIHDTFDKLEIVTLSGVKIPFTERRENDGSQVSINNPTQGLYLIRMTKGSKLLTGKLVVVH